MRRFLLVAVCLLPLLWLPACSSRKEAGDGKMYRMGERAQVGPLIFTVLDTEWLDQLGDPPNAVLPQRRFLAVRMSITNSGITPVTVPLMSLVSPSGERYPELEDAHGLGQWFGLIRTIKPADTLHGRVLFDAPPSEYQLKLTYGTGDPETDTVATVDLPLQLTRPRVPGAQQ